MLKMRKTVDGVKEQMGKLGRGRGLERRRNFGLGCGFLARE